VNAEYFVLIVGNNYVMFFTRGLAKDVIGAMNHFPDCHREKRSDVATQLIDCSRGLPQSPRLLRNDKRREFICRSAATKQSS
jgi:hypothetical protein